MSGIVPNSDVNFEEMQSVADGPQDDVVEKKETQTSASVKHDRDPKTSEDHIPQKKRKTRRGKSKRKQPYMKNRIPVVMKPEAPHNSNQFLLEDHCDIENLDEKLLQHDKATSSTVNRTRDSSFSVDSDAEFYSSPDDEEEFLIKDFDSQYAAFRLEHLHSMSKSELIQDYLNLEQKLDVLSKVFEKHPQTVEDTQKIELELELGRLRNENEALKERNYKLRMKIARMACSSESSSDSESDSSSSSSSSKSSCDINGAETLNNSTSNMDKLNNCTYVH